MCQRTEIELIISRLKQGEVKKFIETDRGGWFLLWTSSGRYRANASKFKSPPKLGSIVSFLPDRRDDKLPKARLRRVESIMFEQEATECPQ